MTPETDLINTLLEDTPPPPPQPPLMNGEGAEPEIVIAPPPAAPPDMCDFLPPPPVNPMEESPELELTSPLETGEAPPLDTVTVFIVMFTF